MLDLWIFFSKLSNTLTGEDDTCRTAKTMLPELLINPDFPSFESCFEVDERGKNGREKRVGR